MGLWRGVRQQDLVKGATAFAGILTKFLPALPSNIPFTATQTWMAHKICAWTTVILLAILIVVLAGDGWLVRRPEMPVPPNTMVDLVYYVCDSQMLKDFGRLATLA